MFKEIAALLGVSSTAVIMAYAFKKYMDNKKKEPIDVDVKITNNIYTTSLGVRG